jgi:hypothetical protein
MLERSSIFGPGFQFLTCYASRMKSSFALRTAARAAVLLMLASCSTAPEVATSSLNLNGTYFGAGQVKAVKADGTEAWSGQLEVQIGVQDAAGRFVPEYQSVIWKGSDVTGLARLIGLQGSAQGSQVAIIPNIGLGCSTVVINGSSASGDLVMDAGSSNVTCTFSESVTVSWSAFTLQKK